MKKELYNILIDGDKGRIMWDNIIANSEDEAIKYCSASYIRNQEDYKIESIEKFELDFNKEVVGEYKIRYIIAEKTKRVREYSNKEGWIVYDAIGFHHTYINSEEVIDAGRYTYKTEGTVDNIEDKVNTWNNPVKLAYAAHVDFNSSKNDPNREIWGKYVDYVKNHEADFFTKSGDWKKRIRAASNRMELEIVDNKTNL